jgi:hypothetical protein
MRGATISNYLTYHERFEIQKNLKISTLLERLSKLSERTKLRLQKSFNYRISVYNLSLGAFYM